MRPLTASIILFKLFVAYCYSIQTTILHVYDFQPYVLQIDLFFLKDLLPMNFRWIYFSLYLHATTIHCLILNTHSIKPKIATFNIEFYVYSTHKISITVLFLLFMKH